jgi:hypothetical protein
MSLTHYPHGVTSFGVPVFPAIDGGVRSGNTYWVYSGAGLDSNDDATIEKPLATIDHAIGHCTANNGDIIYVKEGHTETITAAAQIVCDIAGITIIGLGAGDDRPTITFGTAVGASLSVTAASVTIKNIHFKAGLDNLTAPISVAADNFSLIGCEMEDPSDVEANIWILTTADANDLKILDCFHNGYTGGDQTESLIRLVGCDTALIQGCIFKGNYATAIIEFHTTLSTNVFIHKCFFNENGTTNLTKNVVMTVGACTYLIVDCYDLGAGCKFYGGSGLTVEKELAATYSSSASDMTVNASHFKVYDSHMRIYASDVNNVGSGLETTQSHVKIAASHVVIILSDTKAIASHTVVDSSNIKTAQSHILIGLSHSKVIVSDTASIASHVVVISSNLKSTGSDVIVAASHAKSIASHVVIVVSNTTAGNSHIVVVLSNTTAGNSHIVVMLSDIKTAQSHILVELSHSKVIVSDTKAMASHIVILDTLLDKVYSHVIL